jgi:circadian clock protein KaiC
LDSLETLFSGLSHVTTLRAELRRLFRWLKARNLTAVITCERGPDGSLTRHGIEEYISDCVVVLDNRVNDAVSTRRLRIVKYRGSMHGTNEYPFLIDSEGISVLPVTSLELKHVASAEQISTGVPALDSMFGGDGIYRGSSVLITGKAGSGKTSLLAHYVDAACARGERCVYFSFEESPDEIVRNMRSIGIDLGHWIDVGMLRLHSSRPTSLGLEMHLIRMHKVVADFEPANVVIDPITAMLHSGTALETSSMLVRMIDFFKQKRMTALMTSLTSDSGVAEQTEVDISSLIDTWILLRNIENGGERNRGLFILKARGISHSNQIREFLITNDGVELREVYLGGDGMVTGSSRVIHEAREAAEALLARQKIENWNSTLTRKRKSLEAHMEAIRMQLESEEQEVAQLIEQEQMRLKELHRGRTDIEKSRTLNMGNHAGPKSGSRQ